LASEDTLIPTIDDILNAEAQAKASRAKREAIDRERDVDDPQYAQFSRLPSTNNPLTPPRKLIQAEAKEAAAWAAERLASLATKGKRGSN
jgi:hypothetical protein